jgi:hypothetical protein
VRACVCTVFHSYCYGAGFRIRSVCAGYQNATHPSCLLATVYILPAITRLHTTQTAIFSNTAASNKDKMYISVLVLKFKLYQHALCNSMTSHSDSNDIFGCNFDFMCTSGLRITTQLVETCSHEQQIADLHKAAGCLT